MNAWLQFMAGAAFMAGLAGGLHCAAMCGSLIGAVTLKSGEASSFRWGIALAYNAGRIGSYAIAGAIAGFAGSAGLLFRGAPWMHHILLTLAAGMLILIALYLSGMSRVVQGLEGAGTVLWRAVQPLSRRFLPVDSIGKALGLGAVWGWLPCGMVYAVLLAAMSSADPIEGAVIMTAFGAGTLPNVMGVMLFYRRLSGWLQRAPVRYAAAAVVAALGVTILIGGAVPAAFTGQSLFCRLVPSLSPVPVSLP